VEWTTTTTLLRELRDYANEGAWETFVRRFRPPVTRFLRELGIVERDVEDVTQEVMLAFAQLYRAGRYDRERGRLSRWLFGIAYNHVLRQRHGRETLLQLCLSRARAEFASSTDGAFALVVLDQRNPIELSDCPLPEALRETPEQRCWSAGELAEDGRRFLRNEAVAARSPGTL
jgi:DNA-directed RNA polymerase specialized sigma24 family protein